MKKINSSTNNFFKYKKFKGKVEKIKEKITATNILNRKEIHFINRGEMQWKSKCERKVVNGRE